MIGKTPPLNLVPIEQSEGLEANLLGKLEYFNPAGSIKDRIAKAMIDDAAAKDVYQDFDLMYVVTETDSFRQTRHGWMSSVHGF